MRPILVAIVSTVLGACGGPTDAPPASLSVVPSSTDVTLAQGAGASITLDVTRKNVAGPVTFDIEGLPAGVTATFSAVDQAATKGTLTLAATSTANPGQSTLTIHSSVATSADTSFTIALTVVVTGSYALMSAKDSLVLEQGDASSVEISITRSGGFAGTVSFTATGAPSGVTITPPSSTTGTTGDLSVSTSAASAAGIQSITLTGKTPGLPDQSVTISLRVIQVTPMSWAFCSGETVRWFAVRNDPLGWRRIPPSGSVVSFAPTSIATVAYVVETGGNINTTVMSASAAELGTLAARSCPASGAKSLTGSVSGLTGNQLATVSIGSRTANSSAGQLSYSLTGVPDGARDLIAVRAVADTPTWPRRIPDRLVIRRSLNIADGTAIPVVDFSSGEAVALVANSLTVDGSPPFNGIGGGNIVGSLISAGGTSALLYSFEVATKTSTMYSASAAQLAAGDLHEIHAFFPIANADFGAKYYFKTGTTTTFSIGSQLSSTICTSNGGAYARPTCQFDSQADYDAFGQATLVQASVGRSLTLVATAGYYGGRPVSWLLPTPDLASVSGFDVAWMIKLGEQTVNEVSAGSGRFAVRFGVPPADGETLRYARRISGSWAP